VATVAVVRSSALVCLRFVYFLAVRALGAARFAGRGEDGKTSEILLLRHQLAVLQRQLAATGKRPKLTWADRAVIALLYRLVPEVRRVRLRLILIAATLAGAGLAAARTGHGEPAATGWPSLRDGRRGARPRLIPRQMVPQPAR
jgi:hypothetical protein